MEYLEFFGIGVLGGIVAGFLGIGGGMLVLPILLYIANVEVKIATAISALQTFFAGSFGTLFNYLQKTINIRFGLVFGLTSAVSYFLGSYFTKYIPAAAIKIVYICVAALSIGLFYLKRESGTYIEKNGIAVNLIPDKRSYIKIIPVSLVSGFVFGLLGIGGGALYVPLLVFMFGFPLKIAIGTSLMIIFLSSIFGVAGKLIVIRFDFFLGLAVALGAIAGSRIGTYLNIKTKPKIIKITFIVILVITIIRVALDLFSIFTGRQVFF
jgi:uncharacterized membrane protein YfcA